MFHRLLNVFAMLLLVGCAAPLESDSGDTGFADTGFAGHPALNPENRYRLGNNERYAIEQEAFYALSTKHDGTSTKSYKNGLGTWTASDWNYIASDTAAWTVLYKIFGSYQSVLYTPGKTSWGLGTNGYGYGGQCFAFADLLLYRSGVVSSSQLIINYKSFPKTTPASKAQVGDQIYRNDAGGQHVAIVVKILAGDSAKGTVTSLDVVDSNILGDERILRHIIDDKGTYFGQNLSKYFVADTLPYYGVAYQAN